jgi:hypothetical protein
MWWHKYMSWNKNVSTFRRSNVVAERRWRSFGFEADSWRTQIRLKMSQHTIEDGSEKRDHLE